MFWIHGGAWVLGSAQDMNGAYDGTNLAKLGRVVVVTIQYRLGALGFLSHPALSQEHNTNDGNYGIRDCLEALKWVQRNIKNFGGDPKKVTIFGESAGAMATMFLSTLPEHEVSGLFHRIIAQSPPDMISLSKQEAEKQGVEVAKLHNCHFENSPSQTLECLRSKPFNEIMNSFATDRRYWFFHTGQFDEIEKRGAYFAPTIDGNF